MRCAAPYQVAERSAATPTATTAYQHGEAELDEAGTHQQHREILCHAFLLIAVGRRWVGAERHHSVLAIRLNLDDGEHQLGMLGASCR